MPRSTASTSGRNKNQVAMFEMLTRACPQDKQGRKSINKLAEHLGLSSWAVYSWIKVERIPAKQVPNLLLVGKKRINREEVIQFVV